ncbi:MAG: FAD-dependent oxidoreductase [Phormidesmis sp.]
MPADYDLVILGGTVAGRQAALLAAGYGARVALVEPPELFERRQQAHYLLQGLQQLSESRQRQQVSSWLRSSEPWQEAAGSKGDWPALVKWSAIAAETQLGALSPAVMSTSGIDFVREMPMSVSRNLLVTTAQRRLRARAVLLAFGTVPIDLKALLAASALPKNFCILGGDALAILWAIALGDLGVRVTLVATEFLPSEDADIRRLVRSQLIAAGIVIAQTTEGYVESAEGVVAITPRAPALDLPGFISSCADDRNAVSVNRKLQTCHPRIFACGSILGGSLNSSLARYEAQIAVQNALFLPIQRVNYDSVAVGHHCFARVGLSEAQAQQRYGRATQVWTASSANSAGLSRLSPLPSYCKLVSVHDRLLGVHLFGEGASALIQPMAAMIGHPVRKLDSLQVFSTDGVAHDLAGLVSLAGRQSQRSRWQIGHWRRDWAENWFNWRRSR